jgi:Tfp pilus assembly protein PilF
MISEKIIKEKDACISNAQAVIKGNEQNQKMIAQMVRELNSALPAIRELSEHLGREDNVTGLMVKLGEICFNFGANDNARFFFEKAVSLDSRNGDALNNLGVIHFQQGNFETAKDFFVKALDANPGNREARVNLGLIKQAAVNEK